MAEITPGTIIEGTYRPEDLIPAFTDELERVITGLSANKAAEYHDLIQSTRNESTDAEYIGFALDLIIDALNEFAPDGLLFGAHPGDGCDFGWWPVESEPEPEPILLIAPETDPLAYLEPDMTTRPVQAKTIELWFTPERWGNQDPGRLPLAVDLAHTIDGTPGAIWHGIIIRWTLPTTVDAAELTTMINAGTLNPWLDRIVAGHIRFWDGSNHVAAMSPGANRAADELQRWIETQAPTLTGENAGFRTADELFDFCDTDDFLREYDLDGEPVTDATLTTLERLILADTERDNIRLYGLAEWLRDHLPTPV